MKANTSNTTISLKIRENLYSILLTSTVLILMTFFFGAALLG